MITIKPLDELLQDIKNENNLVFCGYSLVNIDIIKKNKLKNKIKYIFDNNAKNIKSQFKNIKIIDYDRLKNLTNYILVICANYKIEFYKQLKSLKYDNIYIKYDKNMIDYLIGDEKIKFQIEIPDFIDYVNKDDSHKFSIDLVKHFIKLNHIVVTSPTENNNPYSYKKRKKIDKKTILFSYHSIGSSLVCDVIWKEGYLKNTVVFDKKGYSGWSSLCDENIDKLLENISQKKADKFFDKFALNYIKNNDSKYIQSNNVKFNFPKEFVFFPLQLSNDTVAKLSYIKPFKLIKQVVGILDRQNTPLVIKRHPRCKEKKLKKYLFKKAKEKKIILFDGSIHDAISKARTIYTINSGVGFEALLHLKPVVTFGKSDYMSMTKNIIDIKKLEKNLFYKLDDRKKMQIKKFVYYYIKETNLFLDASKNTKRKFIDKVIIDFLNKL
jgi:hypothetical protein